MRQDYDAHNYPGKYEQESPMVQYIDENDLYDEVTGDVDLWGEWIGRAGRWVIRTTCTGFTYGRKCPTVEQAKEIFRQCDKEYQIWYES